MKKYKVDLLSTSSLNQLVKDLEAYKDDLPRKCKTICERLKTIGILVAQANIDASPLGSTITLTYKPISEPSGSGVIIIATGTDFHSADENDKRIFNSLLGVEFGAGIHYNRGNVNPKAKEHGMGVGSYPGQTHAMQDSWIYKGFDNQTHVSHGVKATMPMYKASKTMQAQAIAIIKEVFAYG